jgi:crotonobetainyl-CoA:carnitine CoA-transferase CaiB-like acyl-CoA transferase
VEEKEAFREIFSDLLILGFSWAIVGPLSLRFFADYGARVIRVETSKRPCVTRTSSPYKNGIPGLNRSGYFNYYNANIMSLSLDMTNPKAQDIARRIAAKADVVMENFTPGVMERWGLGYEDLKKLKPDIIMVRQSGFGLSGPYAGVPAYGMILSAISGLLSLVRKGDEEPLPLGVAAYTDCISPRFAAASVIAALEYRDRTGEGMLIELSQFETAVHFVLPAILEYSIEGREPKRLGNRSKLACPSNVYRCKGEDRFCAIEVLNDDQWKNLCEAMGKSTLSHDPRFLSPEKRKEHEEEVDRIVEEWTSTLSAEEITEILQRRGVPAGIVKDARDLYSDPQLRWRNMFWELKHSEVGPFTHLGPSFILSKTPARAKRPSPTLGQDTHTILTEIVGISDEELVELVNEAVLE